MASIAPKPLVVKIKIDTTFTIIKAKATFSEK